MLPSVKIQTYEHYIIKERCKQSVKKNELYYIY